MSATHTAAGVREGDILAGKYRVDRVLGVGGMGVVVAAHHVDLDDRVAIKFLLPEALQNGEAVARFAREAQAAAKIKSEHVARVTDVGRLENGAPYIVMEYLDGLDLSAWLVQRGPLPLEQAVEFVLQACEAIAEAHSLGIVHRDLKPANLFVIRRPSGSLSTKVLDFGIAKRTGAAASANITSTSAVMGSPLYMSPEQLTSSKDADARTDVWALGVILYELVSGESPFVAETMPSVMMKITASEPAPLRSRRPEVPAAFERVVLKCLEKERTKRFQTIGELALALADFGSPRSRASVEHIAGIMAVSAGPHSMANAMPPSGITPANTAGTMATWNQRTLTGKGARGTLFAAIGFGALALLSAAWFALRHGSNAAAGVGAEPTATLSEPAALPPSSGGSVSAASLAPTAPQVALPAASSSPAAMAPPSASANSTGNSAPARTAPAARSGKPRPTTGKTTGKAATAGKLDVYDDRK